MCGKHGDFCGAVWRCVARLDKHLGGICSPDAQLESPQPELHRVTQWGAAEEGDRGSPKQTHFAQTHREHLFPGKLGDHGTLAGLQFGEVNHENPRD